MIAADGGLGFGLLVAAFWFGFRHGIDWDHIAAITDIASSQQDRRSSVVFGTLYALGHASVVLVLGTLAVVAGERLPSGVDATMTRIVGLTLVALGVYVFVSLVRHGRDFRLRSRWMLVFSGARRAARWARTKVGAGVRVRVGGGDGGDDGEASDVVVLPDASQGDDPSDWHHGHHGRPGHHHHVRPEHEDAFANYGRGTSFAVGMLHGVGAETPTQIVIFVTAAGAGGKAAGAAVLVAFVVGLVASNSLITVGSAYGVLRASRNFTLYATVAVITAVSSTVIGALFLLGKQSLLPTMFGG